MPRPEIASQRWRVASFILVPLFALVALMAWGLSSPVGSSADDDFHLASIWCGQGENDSGCEPGTKADERVVARDLVVDSVCFAFNPDASASCQGADFGVNPDDTVQSPRGNHTGLYPPVFYFTMSLFAGDNIENSVLLMKLANSLLFVGLVAALFWLLPLHRRQTLVWSLLITLVPLGMFIIPSTNPSSWAVLSAGTLLLAVLGFMESSGRRRVGLGVVALIATVLGAGARADAAIYSGFAVALALLLTYRRGGQWMIAALGPIALLIVAVVFFFAAGQGGAISGGLASETEPPIDSPVVLAMANLINIPGLWAGAFGATGLGWLDTVMPSSVWFAGIAVFAGAVLIGLGFRVARKGIAISIVALALVVIPTVLLVQSNSIVGANVQPRYILPLIVMLGALVLLQSAETRIRVTPAQKWIIVGAISMANALALHTNIRRYVTGADVASVDLDSGVEWWWDITISPMGVWVAGSLAFAAIVVIVSMRRWNSSATVAPPTDAKVLL
ncbi:hypothetical protein IWX81_002356 [Salinibacterium sp. CAN_S4]|uniref:DUF2142 domain-containing protein n=1 Tax=Salinibacterium sp. CAN_S4 TaxID=2787727 RepID=UPI0018EFBAC8